VFRIGGNTFYDRKNIIPIKIPEFKRSGIGLIVEFCGIPNGFPNLVAKRRAKNPPKKIQFFGNMIPPLPPSPTNVQSMSISLITV
jgi:hypothetical protein